MNKNFFKNDHQINLLDIIKLLDVPISDFWDVNKNITIPLENILILDLVSFKNLKKNQLSFLINKKEINKNVKDGICIVEKENFGILNKNIIKIPFKNPKEGFSKVLKKYFEKYQNQRPFKKIKTHSSVYIHKTAKIGKNVVIGAYSFIGEYVTIEDNVYISERVSIHSNCIIGKECFIGSGVVIENTILGSKVIVSHNSVLGKVGFGFLPNQAKTFLIPHVGSLEIGTGTHIGAGCTIDRGLIDNTSIGKYVMIDNQVHIGHNCVIEDFCILAGQVGLSGSVILKQNVILGGDVSIKDNITIGKNSVVAGASKVFNSFPDDSKIGGFPAQDINSWKRQIATQRLNDKKRKKE